MQQPAQTVDVAGRLRQRPRQLLQGRIAVEFERVEILPRAILLVPRQDLGLGLDFHLPQLLAQPDHRLVQFCQVELDLTDLLLEPAVVNADFAGRVQQVLEQPRVDLRKIAPLARLVALRQSLARYR